MKKSIVQKAVAFFAVCFTMTLVMAACGRAGTSVSAPSDIPKEQIKDNSDVPEEYESVPIEFTSLVKCEGPIAGMVSAFCGSSESVDVQYTDFKDVVKERVFAELMAGIIDAQEHVIGLTDAQQKMFIQAIEQASADTAIGMEIRVLIRQEMQDYFSHAKSLDIVCELLQSRVQLYLAENQ